MFMHALLGSISYAIRVFPTLRIGTKPSEDKQTSEPEPEFMQATATVF
jgi:hypothetical protein